MYWRGVSLAPSTNSKKPAARFKLKTSIPKCFPTSTVQVLGATYQINATDSLPYCLQNAQPVTLQVQGHKRPKPFTGPCGGAGAVACYPGFYAPNPTAPCEPCGLNKICTGGAQADPELVQCPLGTGTASGATEAYDPAQCVVLPCDPCGAATPDLYLTSKLEVYKQPAWTTTIPTTANTAELQCALDDQDPFICQQTSSCTLNDIAIDNQGCVWFVWTAGRYHHRLPLHVFG